MAITFDGYPITSVDYEGTTLTHIADSVPGCRTAMAYAAGTARVCTPRSPTWYFVGFDYRYCLAYGGWQARARIRVCETNCCIGDIRWDNAVAVNDFTESPNPMSVRAAVNLGFARDMYIYGCYPDGCNVSYYFKFPIGVCCTNAGYQCIPGNCGSADIISNVGTLTICSEWTNICACDQQQIRCCSRTSGAWLCYHPYCISVGARQICSNCCYSVVNCLNTWQGSTSLCNNYVIC